MCALVCTVCSWKGCSRRPVTLSDIAQFNSIARGLLNEDPKKCTARGNTLLVNPFENFINTSETSAPLCGRCMGLWDTLAKGRISPSKRKQTQIEHERKFDSAIATLNRMSRKDQARDTPKTCFLCARETRPETRPRTGPHTPSVKSAPLQNDEEVGEICVLSNIQRRDTSDSDIASAPEAVEAIVCASNDRILAENEPEHYSKRSTVVPGSAQNLDTVVASTKCASASELPTRGSQGTIESHTRLVAPHVLQTVQGHAQLNRLKVKLVRSHECLSFAETTELIQNPGAPGNRVCNRHFCALHRMCDELLQGEKSTCAISSCTVKASGSVRTRPVPDISSGTVDEHIAICERVYDLSGGQQEGPELVGKRLCNHCYYMVFRGGDTRASPMPGINPTSSSFGSVEGYVPSLLTIEDKPTRHTATAIISFVSGRGVKPFPPGYEDLKSAADAPCSISTRTTFLMYKSLRAQESLECTSVGTAGKSDSMLSEKTLLKRIAPYLAAKGIDLETYYVCTGQVGATRKRFFTHRRRAGEAAAQAAASGSKSRDAFFGVMGSIMTEAAHLTVEQSIEDLTVLTRRYYENKTRYEERNFCLRDEILCKPPRLWTRTVWEMSSKTRLAKAKKASRVLRDMTAEESGGEQLAWPLSNSRTCVPSFNLLSSRDLSFAATCYANIETRAFRREPAVPGPLGTLIGMTALLEVTSSFHDSLSRVGVCPSYTWANRMRSSVVTASEQKGRMAQVPPHSFAVAATDNFNLFFSHKLQHADSLGSSCILNGTTTQLVTTASRPGLPILSPENAFSRGTSTGCGGTEVRQASPETQPVRPTSSVEEFLDKATPKRSCPLIETWTNLVFGLCHKYQEKLISSGTSHDTAPLSLPMLLSTALKGYGDSSTSITYVEMSRRACDKLGIAETVDLLRQEYIGRETGRGKVLAIVGDAPVFKALFEMWISSLREKTELVSWMIPLPGGFHIEKQGLIPLVKFLWNGAGLQEFASCAGMSLNNTENIVKMGHYRRNKRLLFPMAGAVAIRAAEVVIEADPLVGDDIESILDVTSPNAQRLVDEAEKKGNESLLEMSHVVSQGVLAIGSAIRRGCERLAQQSLNGKFYIVNLILESLIPYTGFYITHRAGQTECPDIFWHFFHNTLFATTKCNYQELALSHSYVRAALPKFTYDCLYRIQTGADGIDRPGAYAVSPSGGETFRCLHIDEAIESGINRSLKAVSVAQDVETLERAVHWIQEFAEAGSVLRRELKVSRQTKGEMSLEGAHCEANPDDLKGRTDRERRTASTLREILKLCQRRGFLGPAHLGASKLTNVLVDPPRVIEDENKANRLLNISEISMTNARLLALQLFKPEFGGLSARDLEVYFGGKQPKSRTSRKRAVQSFIESAGEEDSGHQGKKRKLKDEASKRLAKRKADALRCMTSLMNTRSRLEMSGVPGVNGAVSGVGLGRSGDLLPLQLLSLKTRESLVLSAQFRLSIRAQAYRAELDSKSPKHSAKHKFFEALQESLFERLQSRQTTNEATKFIRNGIGAHPSDTVVVCKDLMNTIYHPLSAFLSEKVRTVRQAMEVRIRMDLFKHIGGARGRQVKVLVLLKDNIFMVTKQKLAERERRDVAGRGGVPQDAMTFRNPEELRRGGISSGREDTTRAHQQQPQGDPGSRGPRCSPQAQPVQARRDSVRNISGSVPASSGGVSGKEAACEPGRLLIPCLDRPLDFSWARTVLADPLVKNCLTSVYAAMGAIAALRIRCEELSKGRTTVPLTVILGNNSLVISDDLLQYKTEYSFEDILVDTCASGEVVLNRRDWPQVIRDGNSWIGGKLVHEKCLVGVTSSGIRLLNEFGESFHYESETLFTWVLRNPALHALLEFCHPCQSRRDEVNSHATMGEIHAIDSACDSPGGDAVAATSFQDGVRGGTILVVSADTDCPMISLLCDDLQGVVHLVGEKYLCVNTMRSLLAQCGISSRDVCLAFGMGGSDISPGTHGVPQHIYCKALLENADVLAAIAPDPVEAASAENCFAWFECLTCFSFALSHSSKSRPFNPQGLALGRSEFYMYTSKFVTESARSVMQLLPEREDIRLQAKRALTLLKYWKASKDSVCNQDVIPFTEANGYNVESAGPLFEPEGAVKRRRKAFSDAVSGCGCKQGCRTQSCRCVALRVACLICDCANGVVPCENTGESHSQTACVPRHTSAPPQGIITNALPPRAIQFTETPDRTATADSRGIVEPRELIKWDQKFRTFVQKDTGDTVAGVGNTQICPDIQPASSETICIASSDSDTLEHDRESEDRSSQSSSGARVVSLPSSDSDSSLI